jgi:hypothetical protein
MSSEYMYDKPHVLIFKTAAGEMVVGTKSIAEVAGQPWFREFMNIGGSVQLKTEVRPEVSQEFVELQREVQELRRRQVELREQQARQPTQVQIQPVQVQSQELSPQVPVRSRTLPSSFLDVTPDIMTRDIWESFSNEQKYQWQQKYPPQV